MDVREEVDVTPFAQLRVQEPIFHSDSHDDQRMMMRIIGNSESFDTVRRKGERKRMAVERFRVQIKLILLQLFPSMAA